jgi:predicted lipoprotein with Yx(FWY)xxD motif
MANNSKKDEAQSQFKKVQRAEEGKKAMSEYESERLAVQAKTVRLKALRLARDAELAAAAPAKPTVVKATKAKTGKSTKASGATLSDWLEDQESSGRER